MAGANRRARAAIRKNAIATPPISTVKRWLVLNAVQDFPRQPNRIIESEPLHRKVRSAQEYYLKRFEQRAAVERLERLEQISVAAVSDMPCNQEENDAVVNKLSIGLLPSQYRKNLRLIYGFEHRLLESSVQGEVSDVSVLPVVFNFYCR